MILDGRGALAIVTLIYFVLALPIAIFVCLRHGFGRNSGWIFLMIFSLIRIAGSIAQLVAEASPSVSSVTAAQVLSSSGFSTLLMAQIGMLQRINEGIPAKHSRIPPIVFRVMIIALIVGLALGITGGVNQTSNNPKDRSSGQTYTHAAGGLFAAAFAVLTLECLYNVRFIRQIIPGDRKLFYVMGLAFPFLLVRLVYVELVDFQVDPANFNTVTGSVLIQGLMASLEEFVVVALFLAAGWGAPKLERKQLMQGRYVDGTVKEGGAAGDYEMNISRGQQVSGSLPRY